MKDETGQALKTVSNDHRCAALRNLLSRKSCLRVLEAHNPISALLVERMIYHDGTRAEPVAYDALWSSSLTDSTERGKPDIEALNIRNRLPNIHDIFEVTTKPLIVDGDTGRMPEHFAIDVPSLERAGVSAVIIEDKRGLKRNSLLGSDVRQLLEDCDEFCRKLAAGKAAQNNADFMIIARIESLIVGAGMDEALRRAKAYVEAGADGIMIHSRQKTHAEVFEFAKRFREYHPHVPLVAVPTSYSHLYFDELARAGFNVVIYANHMLRAAYFAMQQVALEIHRNDRSLEAERMCVEVSEILSLIPGTR